MPDTPTPSRFARLKAKLVPSKRLIIEKLIQVVGWSDRTIPRGVRTLLGIPLIAGGILSFLPILGLWMLPAGLALVALDFPGPRRWLLAWLQRQDEKLNGKTAARDT